MECFLSVMCQEHNGILFSYIKEHSWVSSNEVDETGAYYTEWRKSEKETPIQYINAFMVTMTVYTRQEKRYRCEVQAFGLCGRRWGWDDVREEYWHLYITICRIDDQCKFDAWGRAPIACALGQPRGMGWGGRGGAFRMWGHVHLWLIHVDVWQKPPQYCKVLAAAAAKSLQLCLTLCDPVDSSLPGSPVPGIPQARTLEWVAISFSNAWKWKVKVKLLSHVWLLVTPWTAAHQAPPSMGFSRQ